MLQFQDGKIIDLRSDAGSLPSPGMKKAIIEAEIGDAVLDEDPSKIALEKKATELFEKEAAVFVTSGIMANLVAILAHCDKRSSEVIIGNQSHTWLNEQAGVSQFGGVSIREISEKPDGTFNISELKSKVRGQDPYHEPTTRLVCVENTHNSLGGKVLPIDWLKELKSFAKSTGLALHMDGARIFNAGVKLRMPVSKIVKNVDSVCFCLSKGLGAPYGSILLGTKKFIEKAIRIKLALGGGSTQIGFMAAAGLYSLNHMIERLEEDHDNAQYIANVIREENNPHIIVPLPDDIHTNIIVIKLNKSRITANDFVRRLLTVSDKETRNVLIKAFCLDSETVRFVTCCNISKSDIEDVETKLRFVINEFR